MANKNLKSIKFPGLTDTYVVPQVDSTLTQTGRPADAKATGDAISALGDSVDEEIDALKEDLSTLNTEGTVPTSEQMLSENVTVDSVPYHFRKTASDNADREELEIVGGSVAWNQLINANSASELFSPTATITASNNTVTLTSSAASGNVIRFGKKNGISSIIGHKALLTGVVTTSVAGKLGFYNGTSWTNGANTTAGTPVSFNVIFDVGTNGFVQDTPFGFIPSANMDSDTVVWKNPQIFDLTAMFGSTIADYIYSLEQTTAGAGVALFKQMFPKDYYAYDAGSMQSVIGLSEHKTVGFNIIDESKIVAGNLNTGTGNAQSSTDRCITDFTEITSDREYYCHATYSAGVYAFFYDVNKTYIGYHAYPLNGKTFIPANLSNSKSGATGNIGDTAVYMRLRYDIGAVYNNTLCVNVSDTSLNGQYMPYSGKHSYPLNPNGDLRGIPTLVDGKIKWDGDVYASDGTVTRRYGIVDLGTLNWLKSTQLFYNTAATSIPSYGFNGNRQVISTKYTYAGGTGVSYSGKPDKTIYYDWNQDGVVCIADSAYTDVATFKTAMSGVYLVYELATPTTEQADPYVSPQICSPYGTEEFVSTGIVPVGHNTKYPDNMRAKLDGLPWNFASLIAPTESGFKATRNYTTGALLIVNNVLYKATANIANGATITVGTNVTATTLADVIAAL